MGGGNTSFYSLPSHLTLLYMQYVRKEEVVDLFNQTSSSHPFFGRKKGGEIRLSD